MNRQASAQRPLYNGFYFLLLFLCSINVKAQEYNAHWIFAPQADSTSHVWFRKLFLSDGKPRQAAITVGSTGYFKLYINECNVGTALFYPLRRSNDNEPVFITFDATPYLRADSNVVAVIYSPSTPSINKRQLSVSIYGKDYYGASFSHVSSDSWLCRRANSRMTAEGGEDIDGTEHEPEWKAATIYNQALWLNAGTFRGDATKDIKIYNDGYRAITAKEINCLSNITILQTASVIRPASSFLGFPRITLREAKRGERLQIGDIHYTCSGNMDEQVFPVFKVECWNEIPITGDSRFNINQITTVELINAGEAFFPNF